MIELARDFIKAYPLFTVVVVAACFFFAGATLVQ